MPSSRKRTLQEVDVDSGALLEQAPSTLHRIRNMWQFANLFQFISLFGKVLKVDDNLDIDDLEAECLRPASMTLQDIGLCFLKFLSSHRSLTHELFDEYTRRQYLAKAPERNPFGADDAPARFADFDVFTKIRVLQDMTRFIMTHSERLRERTEEQKDVDQANWRIEPYGWDREDRTYFVLDDNRVYRLTDAPPPAPKPKKNSKKARAALRASKRRRVSAALASDGDDAGDEESDAVRQGDGQPGYDDLGGMRWECIAVTLDEVRCFLSTIQKTKDSNEKVLRDRIQDHLVPILERQEESRKRKQLQREKELLNLEKLANAKRSSRIANKVEHQKHIDQIREDQRRRQEEEAAVRKQEQKHLEMERERNNRQMSREQRLRDREARRLLHEEELAQLSEGSRSVGDGSGRLSQRRLLAEIEKKQQALRKLEEEEEDWVFDCICGVHGKVDDGTHSVACERCNVWQHSKCLNIEEEEAEQENFHFICDSCRRSEQEAGEEQRERPKIIKLRVQRSEPSSVAQKASEDNTMPATLPTVEIPAHQAGEDDLQSRVNGVRVLSLDASAAENGRMPVDATTSNTDPPKSLLNGHGSNVFSSPHPTLSPPDQSPNKSRTYKSIFTQSSPTADGEDDPVSTVANREIQKSDRLVTASSPVDATGSGVPLPRQAEGLTYPTKKMPPVLSTLGTLDIGPSATSNSGSTTGQTTGAPATTPKLTPGHSQSSSQPKNGEQPSPLPSSRSGLSPTKHSPPLPRHQGRQANGVTASVDKTAKATATSSMPAILPPVTALSPSPQQQILTPPVKPSESARLAKGRSSAEGLT